MSSQHGVHMHGVFLPPFPRKENNQNNGPFPTAARTPGSSAIWRYTFCEARVPEWMRLTHYVNYQSDKPDEIGKLPVILQEAGELHEAEESV